MTWPVFLALVAAAGGTLALGDLLGAGARTRAAGAARGLAGLVDSVVALGREGRDPGAVERRRLLLAGSRRRLRRRPPVGRAAGRGRAGGGRALGGRASAESTPRALPPDRRRRYARPGPRAGRRARRRAFAARRRWPRRGARYRARWRTSWGGRWPSSTPARPPTARSRRCAPGCARRGSTPWWRPACSSAAPAATSPACCVRAHGPWRRERGSRASCARPPRRPASPGCSWCCFRWEGRVLAELASPGWVAGLLGSFLTAWLVGIAIVLQAVAAVAIRRLGRVRW